MLAILSHGASFQYPILTLLQTPDGSTGVPVEKVIALVARDLQDYARNQFVPAPSP